MSYPWYDGLYLPAAAATAKQSDFIVLLSTGTVFNLSLALPAFLQTEKPNKYLSGNLESISKVWALSSVRIFKLESKLIS